MKPRVRTAFDAEMAAGTARYGAGALDDAFSCFERAHILGQSFVAAHTRTHWWMLKVGIRRRDAREVVGQVLRMLGSIVLSRIWVPRGNTGGANVRATRSMAIPDDLLEILEDQT